MVRVKLICVGKLKESFYKQAAAEYEKRLKGYCLPEIVELAEERLPDAPSEAEIDAALGRESARIFKSIPPRAYTVVMTPEGKKCDSAGVAKLLSEAEIIGGGTVCFIIGSSFGLDPEVKRRANCLLSMSDMTFPHHLARIMVLEQIYRGYSIRAGGKYDK